MRDAHNFTYWENKRIQKYIREHEQSEFPPTSLKRHVLHQTTFQKRRCLSPKRVRTGNEKKYRGCGRCKPKISSRIDSRTELEFQVKDQTQLEEKNIEIFKNGRHYTGTEFYDETQFYLDVPKELRQNIDIKNFINKEN